MIIYRKMTKALLIFISGILLQSCINPGTTADPEKVVESMARALTKKFPQIPIIEVKELTQSAPYILVDVREQREINISMIPGAISQKEFESQKDIYKNKLVVVYCTIGVRSGTYTKKLIEEGFKAKNLKGGVLAFAHAGFKFVNKGKETKNVHVYGEAWNLLPKTYNGIYK
jgi:rhodanese-related sulfurtransferase